MATDPPYGLSFMGLDWDQALPSKDAFKQVFRVLKPGALAFVMSSPRQDLMWRMCARLEGVGFEMRQSFISWIYKTGFPKAYDAGKGIDKKLGVLEQRKTIGKYLAPRQTERGTLRDEWPTAEYDQSANKNTYGEYSGEAERFDLTEPVSDEAKLWDGWKSQTGLKPALEPILMVNKPFSEPTIVDNVLRWGTGAINVDATRIPIGKGESVEDFDRSTAGLISKSEIYHNDPEKYLLKDHNSTLKGRFPANLLVSDGALDTGEIKQTDSPNRTPKTTGKREGSISGNFGIKPNIGSGRIYSDIGDQSRYFDLDAWAQHHGFLDVPKPDRAERDYGLKGRNKHPTVKPIKLMAFLIELGCPRNGVVLDPFVGSGTTCIAAKQLGCRYIGIEIKKEEYDTAVARVAAYPQPLEWFQEIENE